MDEHKGFELKGGLVGISARELHERLMGVLGLTFRDMVPRPRFVLLLDVSGHVEMGGDMNKAAACRAFADGLAQLEAELAPSTGEPAS